jgi:hypothetical protein
MLLQAWGLSRQGLHHHGRGDYLALPLHNHIDDNMDLYDNVGDTTWVQVQLLDR